MAERAAAAAVAARWTTPKDVLARLRKRFDRGEFLTAYARGAEFEPIDTPLRGPTAGDLGAHFDAAREWVRLWEAAAVRPTGIRLEYREVGGRVIGANRLPARAWIDDFERLWAVLGVEPIVRRFTDLLVDAAELPAVQLWAAANPMKALSQEPRWSELLATVTWILRHQRPGLHVRQVDVPGVDTKFIEAHRAILTDLLEAAVDAERIDPAAPRTDFVRRFRFQPKPDYVRVRTLDPAIPLTGTFTEASFRIGELARSPLPTARILVVENEITYLALPPLPDTAAVWGGGYAVNRLSPLTWLADRELRYWGDIDTHGFAILNRLRTAFPAVRSVLMDRLTLLHHRSQWVSEAAPTNAALPLLAAEEQALYQDLTKDTLGTAVRLEQERIGFGWIEAALRAM